jgi:ABC-2 type transport system ATP-binding protein
MTMNSNPIVVENLKKVYEKRGASGAVEALKGISFEVKPGEIFGLLGPNGAGKTTLISIATTLEKASSGDIFVFGESVTKNSSKTKQKLGVVPQEVVSSGFFNLEEILKYHSGYYGISDNSKRIQELLARLNLTEHKAKMMRQLSGGMKRRMMIAKALVHRPRILLLDEPTAGVDVELRNQLWKFVRDLQSEGVSIILTTHYLQEAESLCDRVGIINKGELKYVGPTQEIIAKLTQKKINITTTGGKNLQFFMTPEETLSQVLSQHDLNVTDVKDIKTSEGSLEEAFMKVLST